MTVKQYLDKVDKVIENGKFKDDWESLKSNPVPEWYKNGKFGLFIHWGVFSVPEYFNEWYPRLMYLKGSKPYFHHIKKYGGAEKFPYKNFVDMFTADKFSPDEWLEVFKASGAKYIMPVAEHHDGFKLYGSELNKWNSVNKGAKRDILDELHKSCDKYGMGFLASHHRAEHYWFLNGARKFDCDVTRGEDKDFYGPAFLPDSGNANAYDTEIKPDEEWLQDWLASACEMIDRNRPLAVYFDWWVMHREFRPYMKKFLAYYYNRGLEWGKEVTVFYKWDSVMKGCAVFDVERGQLNNVSPYIWQNDTAIAKNSWGYTEGNQFKAPADIIRNMIDVVSKNGCYMLNVGPRADGRLCEEEKNVLLKIGKWMNINGEGIYGSEPYNFYGGENSKKKHGSFHENIKYSSKDIRFTYKTGVIYLFIMKPSDKTAYSVRQLALGNNTTHYVVKNIELLGSDAKVEFSQNASALTLKLENAVDTEMPICFKIDIE